jgi:mannose/fructose/N-acetylgalactosamine-specific phosphotransferase system component IIB
MGMTYIRIDDRLIHGQIVVSWCGVLNIKEIIAIDNETASNKMLKQIMTMGVPKGFNPSIVTMEEAKSILEKEPDHNRLVILRHVDKLPEILPYIHNLNTLYLGNIQKTKDSLYNLSFGAGGVLFFSQADIDILEGIHQSGVKILLQMVPQSSQRTWEQAKKAFG